MSVATETLLCTAPATVFEAARSDPDHVRFIEGDDRVSNLDLARRVARFASHLRAAGIGRSDRVAIFAPNSVGWLVAALGTQAAGAAWVGVHAGSSGQLARHVVQHSGARLVVASASELARAGVDALPAPVHLLGDPLDAELPDADPDGPWDDASELDATACLIYTSGTTGPAKGVVLTHRNLATNAADWISIYEDALPDAPREVLWLPFSHIFGWGDACIGVRCRFTSFITDPWDVPAALVEHRPHVLMTVPILLERLASLAGDDAAGDASLRAATGGELRLLLAGGASLSVETKRRFRRASVPVLEGYGLSETSPTLTGTRPGDEEDEGVGEPYPSVEIRLADDGEVLARGPSVFAGYHDDAAASAAVIDDDGWFHTGDLGAWTAAGRLRIVDRKSQLIVLANGKKVAPQSIEALAAADPWIERLVLFGTDETALVGLVLPDPATIGAELGRTLDHGAAAADPDVIVGIARRIHDLNERLSSFERLRAFAIVDRPLTVEAGHLTPSFKVRRQAVWNDFRDLLEGTPRSVREELKA